MSSSSITADFAAVVGGQVAAQDLFELLGEFEERRADRLVAVLLGLLQLLLELLAFEFREAHPSREPFGVDHDPFDAAGDFERFVLHVFAGAAEDGVQQLFFRRQLGLRLRRDLADEDVARLDAGADADDALLVEVPQGLFADVGNVASELFAAQLGLANFDVELVDVDRRVDVVLHQSFGEDDRVLEVVAFPRHEGDEHVAAQRQARRRGWPALSQSTSPFFTR